MSASVTVLEDSLSPDGVRLTTLMCRYPRIIHAEMMTHRVFSRSAASSRAIPVAKMIAAIQRDPYIPSCWGRDQPGMQSEQFFEDPHEIDKAESLWLHARDQAVAQAEKLLDMGVHKQWVNRLLEPFHWYTCLITATEWSNFFHLRCHPAAHPEIRRVAELMRDALEKSTPLGLDYGQWHLPLCPELGESANQYPSKKEDADYWCKISVGRCARVSYLTHDGKRDPQADVALAERLLEAGHTSPFEHVARPATVHDLNSCDQAYLDFMVKRGPESARTMCSTKFFGNFRGWVQLRKEVPYEADILGGSSGRAGV